MLAIPPAILDLLHLEAGDTVGLVVDGDRLLVEPRIKPRYTLRDLLNSSDDSRLANVDSDEQEWLNGAALGRQLL